MLFGYKIWQLENWAENDDFLPVKRILLSFSQLLSVWAVIFFKDLFHQFDQHPQMFRTNIFSHRTEFFVVGIFFNSLRHEKSNLSFLMKKSFYLGSQSLT